MFSLLLAILLFSRMFYFCFFFFFNDTATTEIYTLSLHDALPITAWLAWPTPAHATRSPGLIPRTPGPTSTTTPAELYPTGVSSESFRRTACVVERIPSRRALAATSRTRSGRALALPMRDFCEVSTRERSVPELMTEKALRTRIDPGAQLGAGTSRT